MSPEERIADFLSEFADLDKKYSAKVFFDWHNRLTGSCRLGREEFCKSHNINLINDEFSAREFLELTKNAYGGAIIEKIISRLEELQ